MDYFIPIGIGVVAITIIILSLFFSTEARVKRKLKKAPYMPIADFIDGSMGKIIGQIELQEDFLIAPLSGRKCSYYSVEIEERKQSGKNSSWQTVLEDEKFKHVVVRQGDHVAYLNSTDVKCYLIADANFKSGFRNDASAKLNDYLMAHDLESTSFFGFNKSMRYSEGVLEQGETVVMYGMGVWRNAEELGINSEFDRVLCIESSDKEKVYLTDDPKASEVVFK